jgi:hypothetical protein
MSHRELREIAIQRLRAPVCTQRSLWAPCAVCGESITDTTAECRPAPGLVLCQPCATQVARHIATAVARVATVADAAPQWFNADLLLGAMLGRATQRNGYFPTAIQRAVWVVAVHEFWTAGVSARAA